MHIHRNDLLVLVNGSRVIFFENTGDDNHLSLDMVYSLTCKSKRSIDLGRGPAGRVENSAIHGHASFEQTNLHDKAEENFIKTANLAINTYMKNPQYQHLILFAEPSTLGYLRNIMSPEISSKVIKEVAKDYTKLPIVDLEKLIDEIH